MNNQTEQKKPTLEGTDILFACPKCGKSLTIDCRGAGLNIRCPQCNNEIEVPIPEGFDLSQLDQKIGANGLLPEDEQTIVPVPAAVESAAPEPPASGTVEQIKTLQAELQALRRQYNELLKTAKEVRRPADELRAALDAFSRMLAGLAGPEDDETQKIG